MKKFHALDIDRAYYGGPSSVHSLESYASIGALNNRQAELERLDALNYPDNGMAYLRAVNRAYFGLVSPLSEGAHYAAAENAADRLYSAVFEEMKPRVDEARAEGDIIIVSDGPAPVMQALARRIGAVAAVGRSLAEFEQVATLPSGQKLAGPTKLAKMATAVGQQGYILGHSAELDRAWGDSRIDEPVLAAAQRPVVVNPLDEYMAALGQKPGWEILECVSLTTYGDLSGRLIA